MLMKMNNHSEAWNERKSSLSQREKVLKSELESVSGDFERKAKYVLITSHINFHDNSRGNSYIY